MRGKEFPTIQLAASKTDCKFLCIYSTNPQQLLRGTVFRVGLDKFRGVRKDIHHKKFTCINSPISAKIRNLADFHQRILSNQQAPSGLDIVNTLRYFQQTLLGLLKDVQNVSIDAFVSIKGEQSRSTLFPNLNYSGLYHAVNNIIDVYPQIQSALGSAILNTIQCLYLFLERDLVDQLPYNVACLLSGFPPDLHGDILKLLCNVLLPFTFQNVEESTYGLSSTATVIMMTFQFCQDARYHTWILETLMSLKTDVYKDVLSVIAYGTSESRIPAANLLFYYWPFMNPSLLERKTVQYKTHAWGTTRCQHKNCSSGENNLSIKKCYNPFLSAEYADSAPPIYLCPDCAHNVTEENKKALQRFCQPMSQMVNNCQNKSCGNKAAICTCFSEECIRTNNFVPLRLCHDCYLEKHKDNLRHICHSRLPSPWINENNTSGVLITAIVRYRRFPGVEKKPENISSLKNAKV
uniref:Uncharacterized protein n=1 Tax=Romanomermis culicivorax TaxID=13658 RepID=A0A915IG05_ROMCU